MLWAMIFVAAPIAAVFSLWLPIYRQSVGVCASESLGSVRRSYSKSTESIAFVVAVVLVSSNFPTFRPFYLRRLSLSRLAIAKISLDMLPMADIAMTSMMLSRFDYFADLLVVSFGCWHFY